MEEYKNKIDKIIERISNDSRCKVTFNDNTVVLSLPSELPEEVHYFYSKVKTFTFDDGYNVYKILPSEKIKLANPEIIGDEILAEYPDQYENDKSKDWYIIVDLCGSFITIDTVGKRKGYCYDSTYETHAMPGDCQIIAHSFSDLIVAILDYASEDQPFWLIDGYENLGDAYDDIDT